MKLVSLIFILFATVIATNAQNCKAYIPTEEGTKLERTNYNKKGKITGTVTQEVKEVKQDGNATVFSVHQLYLDKKGENPVESDMNFKCEDNVFYIDMNSFVNGQQMEAYKDMEMKVTMDEIDIPADLSPGQKLEDGRITMDIQSDLPIAMNFEVRITNRKVEAKEKITTPAGTFDCVKILQDIETKTGFSIKMNSVEWYAEGLGAVKTETYRKGKLMGYTELTKIEKP